MSSWMWQAAGGSHPCAADDLVVEAFDAAGATVLSGNSNVDESDTGFSLVTGYRFSSYVAVEATYFDAGKATYDATGMVLLDGQVLPANVRMTAELSGPTLAAIGILPLNERWELYGRAGIFFADMKLRVNAMIAGFTAGESESDSTEDFLAGAGVAARLTDHWTLRRQYTRLLKVGSDDFAGETDVDYFSAEITYAF